MCTSQLHLNISHINNLTKSYYNCCQSSGIMTVITAIIGIYFWSHPKFSVGLCLSSVGSVISSPSSSSDHKHCCLLPSPFIFLIKSLHPQLLASARISTSVGRGIHLAFIISLLSHSQSSTFLPVHAEHSNFIRR